MRSITFKLVGAFILVTFLGTIINALIITRVTDFYFSRYMDSTGQAVARQIASELTIYHHQKGDWDGVGEILYNQPIISSMMQGMERNKQSHEMGERQRMMDMRFVLLDRNGRVIADSSTNNQIFSNDFESEGDPKETITIQDDGKKVGSLLIYETDRDPTSPSNTFIDTANRATWITAGMITLLAVILGLFSFRQIISPVKSMTNAAQQIAQGDLSHRVKVTSKDEIGTLANAFNAMAESLQHDQVLRRNMTADIAHELRTPISVLQANLEAMLDGVLPTNPQEIALLHNETSLLGRLVDDLRLLSLAEAGQLKLQKEEVSAADLVQRAVEPFYSQAEDQKIQLQVEVSPDLPKLWVDRDRMAMVIRNLLSNALRYTPAGGQVSLKIAAQDDPVPQVLVEIRDTGSGIPPEDIPYVFDRFYRADHSRTRSSGGSGIGLAIVKQLVEAHGGRVWVNSPILYDKSTGYGSCFCFTIKIDGKQ